jgi:predicted TIM-barrel enzyme
MKLDSVQSTIVKGLREKIAARRPIVGRHLNPLSGAKSGEADLYALYHTAMFPEHGITSGLMPFGDANRTIIELAGRAVSIARGTPVLAGVAAGDPFRLNHFFLKEIKQAGFAGIQNFPSVAVMDGPFRSHLESGGGYTREVELIRSARQFDLLTAALVFDAEEAMRMTEAGADILVVNSPLKAWGFLEHGSRAEREEVLRALHKMINSARGIREDVILMYGSYDAGDLENASMLVEACPGFDGYWTTNGELSSHATAVSH